MCIELLNENQYSGASILSRWEFTIRLAMQGSRSHAGSSSRRRVMAAMAGLMAHRGHNPVSKPPATIAPPLQAPSRHTRARTHTHIHTHTHRQRERERERGAVSLVVVPASKLPCAAILPTHASLTRLGMLAMALPVGQPRESPGAAQGSLHPVITRGPGLRVGSGVPKPVEF